MANNSLKYLRIDTAQRDALRKQWNQPLLWPLWLGAIALLAFVWWLWRALRQREEAI
jgi:oligopeptide transport system substrate-binding protein